jgi:hypothetical protein
LGCIALGASALESAASVDGLWAVVVWLWLIAELGLVAAGIGCHGLAFCGASDSVLRSRGSQPKNELVIVHGNDVHKNDVHELPVRRMNVRKLSAFANTFTEKRFSQENSPMFTVLSCTKKTFTETENS